MVEKDSPTMEMFEERFSKIPRKSRIWSWSYKSKSRRLPLFGTLITKIPDFR